MTRVLADGRTHEEAVEGVVDQMRAEGRPRFREGDGCALGACLDEIVGRFDADPFVSVFVEAIWRRFEELYP